MPRNVDRLLLPGIDQFVKELQRCRIPDFGGFASAGRRDAVAAGSPDDSTGAFVVRLDLERLSLFGLDGHQPDRTVGGGGDHMLLIGLCNRDDAAVEEAQGLAEFECRTVAGVQVLIGAADDEPIIVEPAPGGFGGRRIDHAESLTVGGMYGDLIESERKTRARRIPRNRSQMRVSDVGRPAYGAGFDVPDKNPSTAVARGKSSLRVPIEFLSLVFGRCVLEPLD
jgi:hypothetical protein